MQGLTKYYSYSDSLCVLCSRSKFITSHKSQRPHDFFPSFLLFFLFEIENCVGRFVYETELLLFALIVVFTDFHEVKIVIWINTYMHGTDVIAYAYAYGTGTHTAHTHKPKNQHSHYSVFEKFHAFFSSSCLMGAAVVLWVSTQTKRYIFILNCKFALIAFAIAFYNICMSQKSGNPFTCTYILHIYYYYFSPNEMIFSRCACRLLQFPVPKKKIIRRKNSHFLVTFLPGDLFHV